MPASFVTQKESYSPEDIELAIEDLRQELEDEENVMKSMTSNTQTKIEEARAFILNHSYLIEAQRESVDSISSKIRQLVVSNEEKLALDKEYKDLVESAEYVAIADSIAHTKSEIKSIEKYLIKKGRRGRPSAPSASEKEQIRD